MPRGMIPGMIERWLSCLMLLWLLNACSVDPETGPAQVKWDRVTCERCRMVLSDHHYAAQIRFLPQGKKRTRVLFFDDVGCAMLWLDKQPWKNAPETRFWVADHRTGDWIDAPSASYVTGRITPMEYGLGAQLDAVPGGLSFEQARQHVEEVEQRFNIHGVQLLDRLRERADKREQRQDKVHLH